MCLCVCVLVCVRVRVRVYPTPNSNYNYKKQYVQWRYFGGFRNMPFFPRKTLFLFFLSTSFYFFKTNGKKICVCLCVCACVCVCSRPPTTITKNNMLGAKSPWGKVVCFEIKLSFLGHFFALITALWFDLRGHKKSVFWVRFFA